MKREASAYTVKAGSLALIYRRGHSSGRPFLHPRRHLPWAAKLRTRFPVDSRLGARLQSNRAKTDWLEHKFMHLWHLVPVRVPAPRTSRESDLDDSMGGFRQKLRLETPIRRSVIDLKVRGKAAFLRCNHGCARRQQTPVCFHDHVPLSLRSLVSTICCLRKAAAYTDPPGHG